MKFVTAQRFALSLPDVVEAPHHDYGLWRVGKARRIFATIPPDQAHLHLFVDDATREEALVLHADFAEKLLWGGKVVGLRVHLAAANTTVVKRLIRAAWDYKSARAGGGA